MRISTLLGSTAVLVAALIVSASQAIAQQAAGMSPTVVVLPKPIVTRDSKLEIKRFPVPDFSMNLKSASAMHPAPTTVYLGNPNLFAEKQKWNKEHDVRLASNE